MSLLPMARVRALAENIPTVTVLPLWGLLRVRVLTINIVLALMSLSNMPPVSPRALANLGTIIMIVVPPRPPTQVRATILSNTPPLAALPNVLPLAPVNLP